MFYLLLVLQGRRMPEFVEMSYCEVDAVSNKAENLKNLSKQVLLVYQTSDF